MDLIWIYICVNCCVYFHVYMGTEEHIYKTKKRAARVKGNDNELCFKISKMFFEKFKANQIGTEFRTITLQLQFYVFI